MAQALEASLRILAAEHLLREIFPELVKFVLWNDHVFIACINYGCSRFHIDISTAYGNLVQFKRPEVRIFDFVPSYLLP